MCGPSRRWTNPRWRTAAVLKNWKTATSRQWLDRLERNLARWRILAIRRVTSVKIRIFKDGGRPFQSVLSAFVGSEPIGIIFIKCCGIGRLKLCWRAMISLIVLGLFNFLMWIWQLSCVKTRFYLRRVGPRFADGLITYWNWPNDGGLVNEWDECAIYLARCLAAWTHVSRLRWALWCY